MTFEPEQIKNRNFARISFIAGAIGFVCSFILPLLVFISLDLSATGEGRPQAMMEFLTGTKMYLIAALLLILYLVSLIFLILSYLRAEKNGYKTAATLGHAFFLFMTLINVLKS